MCLSLGKELSVEDVGVCDKILSLIHCDIFTDLHYLLHDFDKDEPEDIMTADEMSTWSFFREIYHPKCPGELRCRSALMTNIGTIEKQILRNRMI